MKDKHKGHVPELICSVNKWERCKTCGETRRRGAKWFTVCAGKRPDAKTPYYG